MGSRLRASLCCLVCLLVLGATGTVRGEAPAEEPGPLGWRPGEPLTIELVVPPSVALPAEEPAPAGWPPSVTVNELVERSTEFFRNKQYLQSAAELELAYAIDSQPVFRFNMAQAFRFADQAPKAIAHYQRFIALAPTHRLVPEAKGYVADMRVLVAEQERTEMAQRLLLEQKARAKQEIELLGLRAEKAEEEKRILTEQLRKSSRPVYKRGWFWGIISGAFAITATAVGVGVYFAKTPKVEGGFVDIRF